MTEQIFKNEINEDPDFLFLKELKKEILPIVKELNKLIERIIAVSYALLTLIIRIIAESLIHLM
ncbi:hypothetical protein KFE26_09940, partial [Shewanella sp. M16]|uniref:hypothetical protein n=1 Tax=Shewanella sp. M16 TaxID=2830837 RepID=UPI001BAE56D1